MATPMRRLLLVLALIGPAMWSGPVSAQDFDKGVEAYTRGDYATALREWRPLAELGNAIAQYNIGVMYSEGIGVPQDYAEATRWYRMAADQGYTYAQMALGKFYGLGLGVSKDYGESMKWSRLAAEQGEAFAHYVLSAGYASGQGVIQDYVLAHMWANLGAALGDDDALKNRDAIAERLTPDQIAEAQRLARECVARNYKGC